MGKQKKLRNPKKGKLVSMPMKLDDGPIDYDVIHVG